MAVLRKGYGKIVQALRLNKSEKNREKQEAEWVGNRKKGGRTEKKAFRGKPLASPEWF
jgi:trimethylamine:corrinoid methyltransferase-like protein